MAHYLRRSVICERLRLSPSACYRVVGSSYGSLISEDDVVELLNRSRNESQEVLQYLPSDILTPAEVVALPEIADCGVTEREVANWTKRKRRPAPCFRINSHTRRFSRSCFLEWLESTSRVRRGRA